jgi:hypothetical protein
MHFLGRDIFEAAALEITAPVFYFHEIYRLVFLGYNVDFADFGFPVSVYNLKALLL